MARTTASVISTRKMSICNTQALSLFRFEGRAALKCWLKYSMNVGSFDHSSTGHPQRYNQMLGEMLGDMLGDM